MNLIMAWVDAAFIFGTAMIVGFNHKWKYTEPSFADESCSGMGWCCFYFWNRHDCRIQSQVKVHWTKFYAWILFWHVLMLLCIFAPAVKMFSRPVLWISRSSFFAVRKRQRMKHSWCVTGVVALCLWDLALPTVLLGYVSLARQQHKKKEKQNKRKRRYFCSVAVPLKKKGKCFDYLWSWW